MLALQGDQSKYGIPSIKSLLDSIDSYFPEPERDYTSPFIVPIDNSFNVPGRGTVVVGTIKKGTVKKGDAAELIGYDEIIKTNIAGIQVYIYIYMTNLCQLNLYILVSIAQRLYKLLT